MHTVNNHTIQSFDRTISPSGRALVARSDGGRWRFFVSSSQLALVEIEQKGQLSSLPAKQQYISPNGAIEFQGSGAVDVYLTNLSDSQDTKVVTWNAGYLCGGLDRVEYAEKQLTTPDGGFLGAMGSFGGYPAPYTNKCRLYVDLAQQTRIVAYDVDGNTVFQSGVQPVDERLYIDLDTPQGYRWEIRESSPSATGVNYTVIWYRD